MLEHPVSIQVAGDRTSGFHRRWTPAGQGCASAPWRLEAYSWGGLTESRLSSASWILLGPFMLYNVAHFMLPARTRGETRHNLADAVLRLLALTATLQLTTALVGMLLDTAALQAGGSDRLPGLLAWADGARATAALLVVLLAVAVLGLISARTSKDYEARTCSTGSATPEAIKKAWPLTDPGFWRGKELVDRQRALHSAATLAWVTVIAAVPGLPDWSHRICAGAGGAVLLGAAVVTASDRANRYVVARGEPSSSLGRLAWLGWPIATKPRRLAVLLVSVTVTAVTLAVDVVDGTWTGRPSVTDQLADLWLGLSAAQVVLLVLLAVLVRWTLPVRAHRAAGPGPFLGGHLSTVFVVLAVVLGGVLSAVVAIGFAKLFGEPMPSGPTGAPNTIAVPWPLYAFAAAPLVVPIAAVAVGILLFLRFRSGRGAYEAQVGETYGASTDPANGVSAARSAGDRRRVAGAWAAADLLDDTGRVVAIVTASGALFVLSTGCALALRGGHDGRMIETVLSVGTLLAVLIAGGLVALLRSAYADSTRRRAIGTVWDVGTFWPRATHPLAPPCYAERAVPEVVDRIRVLTGRVPDHANDTARILVTTQQPNGQAPDPGLSVPAGPVLLTGYSQGSILAPAVVAQLPPDARRDTALLTLACPARRLYGRAFPAFFGPEQLAVLATLMTGNDAVRRWTNVVRRSDYIGSWVGRAPRAECALPGLGEVDVWINDPVALVPDAHPAPPTIHRHSGWWPDPQVCPHATKLVDLIDPLAYPSGVPCPDLQHQVFGCRRSGGGRSVECGSHRSRHEGPDARR